MNELTFAYAAYLPLVGGAAFFIFLLYCLNIRRRNRMLRLRSKTMSGKFFGTFRLVCYAITISLIAACIGLLFLQPSLRAKLEEPEYEPLEIVLADDISISMLAQATEDECGPSRLTIAKKEEDKFISLIEAKGADRVGLVVFSRFGYRLIPVPTKDYALFRRRAQRADETMMWDLPSGTNHWDAVREAVRTFDPGSKLKRVLIIVTDGEPSAPPEVLEKSRKEALQKLSELGKVSLYVLGVGDPGISYPIPTSRDEKGCPKNFLVQKEGEGAGKILFTQPDITRLNQFASELGGQYEHSRTGEELSEMLKGVIDKERVQIGTKDIFTYHPLTKYILLLTLSLLFVLPILKTP